MFLVLLQNTPYSFEVSQTNMIFTAERYYVDFKMTNNYFPVWNAGCICSPVGVVIFQPHRSFTKLLIQWNLSKVDTYGIEVFVRFREVSALESFELKSSQI